MYSLKRMLSFVITIIMMFNFLVPVITEAADAQQDNEYIYYTDLFYKYPYYLSSDAFIKQYDNDINYVFDTVYNNYKNSAQMYGTGIEYALETITSPGDFTKFISDTLGITDFSYNDALDVANQKFVVELLGEPSLNSIAVAYGKTNGIVGKMNKIFETFNKLELTSDSGQINLTSEYYLQEIYDLLWDKGILSHLSDETVSQLWIELNDPNFKLNDYFKKTSKGIDIAKAIVTSLMMEDVRMELIDGIIATQTSNTILKQGMVRLKNQLSGGFITYFLNNYLVKKVADKICDVIGTFAFGAITDNDITPILKIIKVVFFDILFDVPSYGDVLAYQVLNCYSKDLASAIHNKAQEYTAGPFYSDKIFEYEDLFSAYIAVNQAAIKMLQMIADTMDPYEDIYAFFEEAVANNISHVILEYIINNNKMEVYMASNITKEELSLQLKAIISSGTSSIIVKNGIRQKSVGFKAAACAAAMYEGIETSQTPIIEFNEKYKSLNIYQEHINSAIKKVLSTLAEERAAISADVYGSWTYTFDSDTKIRCGSDTLERGVIYTVNNSIFGNVVGSNYTFPDNIEICIEGNFAANCFDTITIPSNTIVTVSGNFEVNAWGWSTEYRTTVINNGVVNIKGYLYGYGNLYGPGKYYVNRITVNASNSISFYNAYLEIQGNTNSIKVNCQNVRLVIRSNAPQVVYVSGKLISFDVYSPNLTLYAYLSITERLDYHQNLVIHGDNNSFRLYSGIYLAPNNTYHYLTFNNHYIINNNINATKLTFNEGFTVSNGNYNINSDVVVNNMNSNTASINSGSSLTIHGSLTFEFASNKIYNNGTLTIYGTVKKPGYFYGTGIYNINSIAAEGLVFGEGEFNISGDITGPVNAINAGCVNLNGTQMQNVAFSSVSRLNINNVVGTTFTAPLKSTVLFNHNQNPYTLYDNGTGSTFVDYDLDGLKDNVDPYPMKGNPCTVNVLVNNEAYGYVSEKAIQSFVGSDVTLSATPTFKYKFSHWIDSKGVTVSTSPTVTIVPMGNSTYTAVFVKRSRPIVVNTTGGKIIVPSSAEIESNVTVSVIEDEGYVYKNNSLSCNGTIFEGYTFVMPDENVVLSAEFQRNENYFLLKEKIREAESYVYNNYSKESYNNLQRTIGVAKTMLTNSISEYAANYQISFLQEAITSLEERYVTKIELDGAPIIYANVPSMIEEILLKVTYDNGTTETITGENCEIIGFDCSLLNSAQTVEIKYKEFATTVSISVSPRDILDCEIAGFSDMEFNGVDEQYTQNLTITYSRTGEILKEGTDYYIEYNDNTSVGEATCSIYGINTYEGVFVDTFVIYCLHDNFDLLEFEEASCNSMGYYKYACELCDYKKTEFVNVIGHSYSDEYVRDSATDSMYRICTYCNEKVNVSTISGDTAYRYVLVTNPVPGKTYLIASGTGEAGDRVNVVGLSGKTTADKEQTISIPLVFDGRNVIENFDGSENYEWNLVKGMPEVQAGGPEYGPASFMFQNVATGAWLYNPVFETGDGRNLSSTSNPVIDEYDPNSRIIFDSANGAAKNVYISNTNNTDVTQTTLWAQFDTNTAFDPWVNINLHNMDSVYSNLLLTYHPNNVSSETVGRLYINSSENNNTYSQNDSIYWKVGTDNWVSVATDLKLNGGIFSWANGISAWKGKIGSIRFDYQDQNVVAGGGLWVDSIIFVPNSYTNLGLLHNRQNSAWYGRSGLYPSHRFPWTQFCNEGTSILTSGNIMSNTGITKTGGEKNYTEVTTQYKYFYGWNEGEFCRQWESTEDLGGVYFYEKQPLVDAVERWERVTSVSEITSDGEYIIVDIYDGTNGKYLLESDFTLDEGNNMLLDGNCFGIGVPEEKIWKFIKVSADTRTNTTSSDDFYFYIQNVATGDILAYDPIGYAGTFNVMPQAATGGLEYYGQEYLWKYDFEQECLVAYSVNQNQGEAQTSTSIGIENGAVKADETGATCYIFKKVSCSHENVTVIEKIDSETCETLGYELSQCDICGCKIKTVLENDSHNYISSVTAPTCVEEGYTTYTCTVCGEIKVADYVEATGHTFSEEFTVDVEPTETTPGSKSRHCLNCDEVTDVTEIEPITKIVLGDVNGDNEVNAKDRLNMKKYLAGCLDPESVKLYNMDINGDGKINLKDSLALRKMLG